MCAYFLSFLLPFPIAVFFFQFFFFSSHFYSFLRAHFFVLSFSLAQNEKSSVSVDNTICLCVNIAWRQVTQNKRLPKLVMRRIPDRIGVYAMYHVRGPRIFYWCLLNDCMCVCVCACVCVFVSIKRNFIAFHRIAVGNTTRTIQEMWQLETLLTKRQTSAWRCSFLVSIFLSVFVFTSHNSYTY